MGIMNVLHPRKGHAVMTWSTTDKQSVEEVRAAFDELVGNGMFAYETTPEGEDVQLRKFNQDADEITIIPPPQGG